jgi:hypothetical protein
MMKRSTFHWIHAGAILSMVVLLAGPVGADPVMVLIMEGVGDKFESAPVKPDYFYCSPDVQVQKFGQHPAFRIEITGHCTTHPGQAPPGWTPDWKAVRFFGEYDYTNGQARERLWSTTHQGSVYDVTLSCPPAQNPWIYTAACRVTGGNPGARTVLPYSGAKLSGIQRKSIMDWEASLGQNQEAPMDLAPKKDPPVILSPVSGQSFKEQVRIRLTPGSPSTVSTEYELQFRPKPSGGMISSTSSNWRSVGGVALHDTSADPGGVSIPSVAFGKEGNWQVRARMNTSGAVWGRPVDFGINLKLGQLPRAAMPMPGAQEGTSEQMKGVGRPSAAPAPNTALGSAPGQLQTPGSPPSPGSVQQIGRPLIAPKKPEEGERERIADP